MGLRKLTISNFKSYCGKLEIPFNGKPSVAIVGPNGSGKSNMLDAICFVMGLSISRLRAQSIENLVHKSNAESMFVSAEVGLSSSLEDSDHACDQTASIKFKRTVDEFFIDDVSVTHEVYTEKWTEVNVLPGASNCVIMQGDIDKLMHSESRELAGLIELLQPASESKKTIEDRNECEAIKQQLEEAAQASRKFLSARRTAQAKIDEAESVGASSEKLSAMRAELKKSKSRRKELSLSEKRSALEALKRKIAEAHTEVENSRTEMELMNADTKKSRSEYARKRKQLQSARNAEQEALEAAAACEAEIAPLERKQAAIETELRLQVPDFEYAQENVKNAENEVTAAKRALQSVDRTREREQTADEAHSANSTFPSQELRDLWIQKNSEFISETAPQQDKLHIMKQKVESAERRLHAAERHAEDHESDVRASNFQLRQQELRVQQLQGLLEERRTQKREYQEELAQIAESLQNSRREQCETGEKLQELNQKVKTADVNKRALAKRHKLLDTVERLRRANPGVHDLSGSIVTPSEDRFSVALERASGKNGDALIVDNVETAMACIKQARREQLGISEFLPLSDLQNRDLAGSRAFLSRQAANGKDIRLMLDCGHFEQRFRPAVLYALGDTAFVPTFTDGMSIRRSGAKMRIIDAQGSVISQNNTISASFGGSSSQQNNLSDRSLAILQRKIISFSESLKSNANEETEFEDKEIRITAKIDRCIKSIENSEKELEIAERQLDSLKRSHEYLSERSEEYQTHVADARDSLKVLQDDLGVHSDELRKLRLKKFRPFLRKSGGNLADWDEQFLIGASRITELANKRQSLEERLTVALSQLDIAKNQLDRYKQRHNISEAAKDKLTNQLAEAISELNTARHKFERAQSRVSSLKAETESRSDEMGAAESSAEALRARVATAEQEEHRRAMELAAEFENDAGAGLSDSDDLQSENSDYDRRGRTSQARLPSNLTTKNKRKRTDKSSLRRDKFNDTETLSLDRLDARIRELKGEIEPLAVLMNMMRGSAKGNSKEETMRATEICADLDKTTEELRSQHDNLSKRLNVLSERRTKRFKAILAELQVNLSDIYSQLAGGDAQAKLTVIEEKLPFEGIDFQAMPPNKAFKPIIQLSGGERSMAALSFLFACQKLHPAPFVISDEVDAASDFDNVGAIASYIQNNSVHTQFIMVSLKQRLFQTAKHLIGVYKQKFKSDILTIESGI